MKRIFCLLLCLGLFFSMQPTFAAEPQIVDFKLDAYNYCVDVNGTEPIKAIMVYSDGSEKQVIDVKMYESNKSLYTPAYLKDHSVQIVRQEIVFTPVNTGIAKIDGNGMINGIGEGNTVFTATCGERTTFAVAIVRKEKELEWKKDVPADKIWVVNFHRNVADNMITDENIIVYDDKNQKVAAGINTCSDRRLAVITPPAGGYQPGKTYRLYIGGRIKFKDSSDYLFNSYITKFTISQ